MNTKDTFVIQGLAGARILKGTVNINGAKNAALKAIAATVLFDGPVRLENVPNTDDIHTMTEILKKLGAKVKWCEILKQATKPTLPPTSLNGVERLGLVGGMSSATEACLPIVLEIDAIGINSTNIDHKLAKSMRASVVLTGPLLAKFGKVSLPAPGGCVIGARPINLFTEGYKKMGANVILKDSIYHIEAPKSLNGTDIHFDKISVGATETLMMAAVLAKGKTILRNCAVEPEIGNVAAWLNACGANIKGVGTPTIEIEGTNGKLLSSEKASFMTIPDRIEAGSFLILGALCAEELTINNCEPKHLESLIDLLKSSGVPIISTDSTLAIKGNTKANSSFKPLNVKTHEYPGFPTDLQAPVAVFLTQVTGESTVEENIFEGRFKYVDDLKKMGALIIEENLQKIIINGPTQLTDAGHMELNAHDIRAGFAIVLAALVGKGKFIINNIHLIDRGYESLEKKLWALGANIKRV